MGAALGMDTDAMGSTVRTGLGMARSGGAVFMAGLDSDSA
jgi:hypothetical protein